MLRKRVVTALLLFAALLVVLWLDGAFPWFAIAAAVVASLGLWEFYGMVSASGKGKPVVWLGIALAILFIFSPLVEWGNEGGILLTVSIILPLVWVMARKNREGACSSWAFTLAGVLYLGWLASRYVALIRLDHGKEWVILALMVTFASDTCAYFIGSWFGRHKMAPGISPGKTWEGAAGGLVGAVGMGIFMAWLFKLPLAVWQAASLSAVAAIFAQAGDLVESLFKRNMGAKDSGNSLPGHGGILDRVDSVVFAGLVVYYYVIWLA